MNVCMGRSIPSMSHRVRRLQKGADEFSQGLDDGSVALEPAREPRVRPKFGQTVFRFRTIVIDL
jgi:hypothetical protein